MHHTFSMRMHMNGDRCHLGGGGGGEGHDGDPRQLLPNHAQPPVRWPEVMAPVYTKCLPVSIYTTKLLPLEIDTQVWLRAVTRTHGCFRKPVSRGQ